MMMSKIASSILVLSSFVAASAYADDGGKIYTGGEKGSYYSKLAPRLSSFVAKNQFELKPVTSKGSEENVRSIATDPTSVALAQSDVVASMVQQDADLAKKIMVIRNDVVSECIFAVVSAETFKTINNWGTARRLGNRIKIATDALGSGSNATLRYIESMDDRFNAKNIINTASADEAINMVNSGAATMAVFVQYGDPDNSRFTGIAEKNMEFVPVLDRKLIQTEISGQKVYQVAEVPVTPPGYFTSSKTVKTVCTPLAYITGTQVKESDKRDHDELIDSIKQATEADLIPQDPLFARLKKQVQKMGAGAVSNMVDLVEKAAK